MKKALVTILAFLYITIAGGVVVNVHYCMGSITSVDYGYHAQGTCGICGMKERKGCCHTEHKIVKLQDAHQQVSLTITLTPASPGIISYCGITLNDKLILNRNSSGYHSPPPQWANSVYLHKNVFRI